VREMEISLGHGEDDRFYMNQLICFISGAFESVVGLPYPFPSAFTWRARGVAIDSPSRKMFDDLIAFPFSPPTSVLCYHPGV